MGMSKRMKMAVLRFAGALAFVGTQQGWAQTPTPQKKTPSTGQGTTTKKRPATSASSYDRALLKPALLKANAPEQYKVKFVTTRGEFTLTVNRAWAPLGADRFYNL